MLRQLKNVTDGGKAPWFSASIAGIVAFVLTLSFTIAGMHFFAAVIIGGLAGAAAIYLIDSRNSS